MRTRFRSSSDNKTESKDLCFISDFRVVPVSLSVARSIIFKLFFLVILSAIIAVQ